MDVSLRLAEFTFNVPMSQFKPSVTHFWKDAVIYHDRLKLIAKYSESPLFLCLKCCVNEHLDPYNVNKKRDFLSCDMIPKIKNK